MSPQRTNPAPSPRAAATRGEAGSAYIVVLLVLVVLAIFGIALSLITQTESQVGANERTLNRTFYAGEAGIRRAVMRALVKDDHTPQSFFYTDSGEAFVGGKLELGTQVEVSAFHPIQVTACNLCEINGEDTYSGKAYKKVTHAVTSRATRFATLNAGGTRTPIAHKTISAMIAAEPYLASVTSMATVNDPAELAKIKF
jgi:hypothetical protein